MSDKSTEISLEEGLYLRQSYFDKAKRIVIKVGSAVLTDDSGIDDTVIRNIAKELCFLKNSGREVILVSSGAVAAGKRKIIIPDTLEIGLDEKQALAAIGQPSLMQSYETAFGECGQTVAQVLLTHSDRSARFSGNSERALSCALAGQPSTRSPLFRQGP